MKSTMKATADYVGQWKVDYRRLAVFVNESGWQALGHHAKEMSD